MITGKVQLASPLKYTKAAQVMGLSGAFEVAVLLGTSGRLRTAQQTRRAQLALKGGLAKLRGQALLVSLVLIHPKLWDAHLCLALVGGRAGGGGAVLSFCFSPSGTSENINTKEPVLPH